jgi:hypothetical protein
MGSSAAARLFDTLNPGYLVVVGLNESGSPHGAQLAEPSARTC